MGSGSPDLMGTGETGRIHSLGDLVRSALCPAHLCRTPQCSSGPPQLQPHAGLCPMLCLQIIFEGVRGTSYEGDIAIDDVTLKKGDCPRKPAGPNKGESLCASEENKSVGVPTCMHGLGICR